TTTDPPKQHTGRGAAYGRRILTSHRDSRFQQVREQDGAETDQRHFPVQAEASKGAEGSDRDQVLAGEQRGRRLGSGQELGGRGFRLLDASQVEANQSLIELDLMLGQLLDVALMTVRGGGDRPHVAEVSNPAVAVLDEVPDAPF